MIITIEIISFTEPLVGTVLEQAQGWRWDTIFCVTIKSLEEDFSSLNPFSVLYKLGGFEQLYFLKLVFFANLMVSGILLFAPISL